MATAKVRLVIELDGGIVHCVYSDDPNVEILIADYDVEGIDPTEYTKHTDDGAASEYIILAPGVLHNPRWISRIYSQKEKENANEMESSS